MPSLEQYLTRTRSDLSFRVSSIFPPPRSEPLNPHTENYKDDGHVITMTLSKFFSGLAEYATYLDGGRRSHISLTDGEGQEAFIFLSTDCKNLILDPEALPWSCIISPRQQEQKNVAAAVSTLSVSGEPVRLESSNGHVYGVLFPMVTLDR